MDLRPKLFFDGSKGEKTTLEEGDLMIVHHCGTVGFHRGGKRLIGVMGDDKFYAQGELHNQTITHFFAHLGIGTEIIEETDRMRVYRLSMR